MKKVIVFFLLISTVLCTFGCSQEPVVVPMATEIIEKNFADIQPLDIASLTPDKTYICQNKDVMSSYYKMTLEQMQGACKYYEEQGYTQYSYHEAGENISATYAKDAQMAHLYWIKCEKRLTIITSDKNGAALPVKNPATRTGNVKTTVTQLKSPETNGMGYIIQLADGSFIIYDGGRETVMEEFWRVLNELTPDGEEILIRAWVITHAHGDHFDLFHAFSGKYADKVTVERFLISPVSHDTEQKINKYLDKGFLEDAAAFKDAEICYVYTGMVFTFCNLRMEILMTHQDVYYIDAISDKFNSSCTISRVYSDDCNMLFLADATNDETEVMACYYGDYLKSDMCQMSHHGYSNCPLVVYRHIKASILWYPCDKASYLNSASDIDVRESLRKSKYSMEIINHDEESVTKEFVKQ